tara:strand:+ start:76 stop:216 length:141 start_codon:yes stop_codon:yes gene_type:complete
MIKIKKILKNKKFFKYILAGSFLFFLIKGIIWLVILSLIWFGIDNL